MTLTDGLIRLDNKLTLGMKISRLENLRDRKRKLAEKIVTNNDPRYVGYLKTLVEELGHRINNLNRHIIAEI